MLPEKRSLSCRMRAYPATTLVIQLVPVDEPVFKASSWADV